MLENQRKSVREEVNEGQMKRMEENDSGLSRSVSDGGLDMCMWCARSASLGAIVVLCYLMLNNWQLKGGHDHYVEQQNLGRKR